MEISFPEQETPNRSILGQAFRAGSLGQALRDDGPSRHLTKLLVRISALVLGKD